jgi:hypothetical protein
VEISYATFNTPPSFSRRRFRYDEGATRSSLGVSASTPVSHGRRGHRQGTVTDQARIAGAAVASATSTVT